MVATPRQRDRGRGGVERLSEALHPNPRLVLQPQQPSLQPQQPPLQPWHWLHVAPRRAHLSVHPHAASPHPRVADIHRLEQHVAKMKHREQAQQNEIGRLKKRVLRLESQLSSTLSPRSNFVAG